MFKVEDIIIMENRTEIVLAVKEDSYIIAVIYNPTLLKIGGVEPREVSKKIVESLYKIYDQNIHPMNIKVDEVRRIVFKK